MSLTIEYKLTNDLIPYINNSRIHNPAQVQQLAASLKEFGWTNPILIDDENGIIAGHGRLLAAQLLNQDKVPTIKLSNLSEGQRKAYIIADNKLALNAGWDEELLKIEFETLKEIKDIDLTITGFNVDEINILFNGWQSDIDSMESIKALDSLNKERIIIKCEPHEKDMVWEAVTNAVDSLGLSNVEIT